MSSAQERLFQMELMRRQEDGRDGLREMIGSLGVGADQFMRTLERLSPHEESGFSAASTPRRARR